MPHISIATSPLTKLSAPLNPLPVAAASPSSQQSPRSVSADQLRRSDSTSRPHSAVPSPGPQIGEARRKNFSFLLRPEIYHPLTPLNVPLSFRHSPHVPDPETPIEELVAHGHFRAAAIAAFQDLTGTGAGDGVDPKDAKRVFELLYTRLACLTLIDATQLAAQEVKALEDLNSVRTYVDEVTGEHLVPWELRVLNVRLQSLGFGDPRRSVMSYYDLAKEAREHIAKNATRSHAPESELWKTRLWDLGIRVAGALIDMEDLSGAAHHLATLPGDEGGKLAFCKALLWLRLGDSERARECARLCSKGVDSVNKEDILLALCDMADANYEAALQRWQEIRLSSDDEMLSINAAVCLLYLGRMPEVRCYSLFWILFLSKFWLILWAGPQYFGGNRRCRPVITYAALQPVDNVRTLHREKSHVENEAGRSSGRPSSFDSRMGEAQQRLQAVVGDSIGRRH